MTPLAKTYSPSQIPRATRRDRKASNSALWARPLTAVSSRVREPESSSLERLLRQSCRPSAFGSRVDFSLLPRPTNRTCTSLPKDRETKLWTTKGAEETRVSLRGEVSDEAISVFGQRLLRSARNDTLTLCHAVGVLSHSPKPYRARWAPCLQCSSGRLP